MTGGGQRLGLFRNKGCDILGRCGQNGFRVLCTGGISSGCTVERHIQVPRRKLLGMGWIFHAGQATIQHSGGVTNPGGRRNWWPSEPNGKIKCLGDDVHRHTRDGLKN
eukprot:13715953-Ditylum_brightwellii.AAC.1